MGNFGTDEIGEKCASFFLKLGKNSVMFSLIGNLSYRLKIFSYFGIFQFQPNGKKFGTRNLTLFHVEKKPCVT